MISVIMSTYNEPLSLIIESLNSIMNQTYTNLEILVCLDNPASKNNNKIIEFTKKDSRIKIMRNLVNLGLPKTLNRLIEASHGDYIARMDADDIAINTRLEDELKFLQRNHLDLVASNVSDMDMDGNNSGIITGYPQRDKRIKEYLKYGDCMPHPTWLGTREIFLRLKGYIDINACEDYDFILRGAVDGFRYGVYTKPLLRYRINDLSISHTNNIDQIVTSIYLQAMYSQKEIPSINDIESFKRKPEGKKLRSDIVDYFNIIKYSNKSVILRSTDRVKLLCTNSFARRELKNKFLRNIIRKEK